MSIFIIIIRTFFSDINHYIAIIILIIYPVFFIIGNAVLNTEL